MADCLVPALSPARAAPAFAVRPLVREKLAVPRLVYPKRPAPEFLAVKLRDRIFRVFHFNESETARAVPFAVRDDFCGADASELLKMFLELFFCGIVRKVAHKDFFYQKFLLLKVDKVLQGFSAPEEL